MDFSQASIYVGTYGKYNAGSIFGKWFDLSDYSDKDEFIKACKELHCDESDPELMFQDWEYITDEFISESYLSANFFVVRDAVENELSDRQQAAFFVWLNSKGESIEESDIDNLIAGFHDDYLGEYDSEEDYAMELVDECYDLPEIAKTYFDYKQFARDLFMSDYSFDSGFVFRFS